LHPAKTHFQNAIALAQWQAAYASVVSNLMQSHQVIAKRERLRHGTSCGIKVVALTRFVLIHPSHFLLKNRASGQLRLKFLRNYS
jgi:hypothetical protein